jgi:hypothetical protein
MSQTTVVDNEYITIVYIPEKKMVYHTIHKPVGGQIFRDALNAGTEALKKNKAYKWLSDDRKNGPLSAEDADWGFNDWNRRTIAAGWKYWAVVVPEQAASAGTLTKTIMDLATLNLRMMVFTNLEAAMKWLDQMEG